MGGGEMGGSGGAKRAMPASQNRDTGARVLRGRRECRPEVVDSACYLVDMCFLVTWGLLGWLVDGVVQVGEIREEAAEVWRPKDSLDWRDE